MSFLFGYVESPKQLKELMDYIHQEKESIRRLVLRDNGSKVQAVQFESLLKYFKISEKSVRLIKSRLLAQKMMLMLQLFFMFLVVPRRVVLVVGDLRSKPAQLLIAVARIKGNKVVAVDDGLYIVDYLKKNYLNNITIYSDIDFGNLNSDIPSSLVFKKKSREVKLSAESASSSVVFVGTKLAEIGFMTKGVYLDVLRAIAKNNREKNLLYYAHREEAVEKLAEIKSLGYEVIRPDFPIDIYMLKNGAPRGNYYSFYSTAIIELHRLVEGAHFFSVKPRNNNFWPERNRDAIDACYDLIESRGIDLLLLEDLCDDSPTVQTPLLF